MSTSHRYWLSVLLCAGCHASPRSTGAAPLACPTVNDVTIAPCSVRAIDLLTADEIHRTHLDGLTAFDLLLQLRPEFVRARPTADGLLLGRPGLLINDAPTAGLEELRAIPAARIQQIRFVRPMEAAIYGSRFPAGVVLVSLR